MTSLTSLLRGTRKSQGRLAAPRGMTLVEIMIVITIMAAIMGVVSISVFGVLDQANAKEAKIEVSNLKGMVNQYYIQNRKLPSNLDELTQGPAPITKSIPKDPWGQEYVYRKEGNRNFVIISKGADGQVGTDDDVSTDSKQGGGGA
jgi:general secretion pathway protein G